MFGPADCQDNQFDEYVNEIELAKTSKMSFNLAVIPFNYEYAWYSS